MNDESRPTRDGGMGLAELIVAIGIFTLVMVALGSTAVLAVRTVGNMQNRVDNATQTELGLGSATKVLRTAVLPKQLDDSTCTGCEDTAVIKASPTEVSFHANLGRTSIGPSLVTLVFFQDPHHPGTGVLEQRTIDPTAGANNTYTFCTAGSAGCKVYKRILSRSLVWPTQPIFSYYDTDGKLMTGNPLSASQKARISSVDVVLTAQSRPGQDKFAALTTVQRVRLPNVEIHVSDTTE